jgi:hypothetical protein
MTTRELYARKYEAQMHEWSAQLDVMAARIQKATAQARLEVQPHFDSVQAKFDAAKAKLAELKDSADDKLHALGEGFDRAWREVEAAAAGAYDVLRRHEKPEG